MLRRLVVTIAEPGGAGRIRTDDRLLAKQMLYQLSYDPLTGRKTVKNLLFETYFVRSIRTHTGKPVSRP